MTSSSLLKVLAVASSLLLMGVFVSYRAGALDWLRAPGVPAGDRTGELPTPPDAPGEAKEIIYSTKSAKVFLFNGEPFEAEESDAPAATPGEDNTIFSGTKDAIIFSGSKSLMPSDPTPPPPPVQAPQAQPQLPSQNNTIMVGPKSPGGF